MLRSAAPLLLCLCFLPACSPTYNWREVRVESTSLKAMLPCKPEQTSRELPIAGRAVNFSATGCETGGFAFALLTADMGSASEAVDVLAHWKAATVAGMRGAISLETPFVPGGALPLRESVRIVANGRRGDGTSVESHAAYFAQGGRVFQAVIYGSRISPELDEAFFSGLRLE